jgi:hypothetical protein
MPKKINTDSDIFQLYQPGSDEEIHGHLEK